MTQTSRGAKKQDAVQQGVVDSPNGSYGMCGLDYSPLMFAALMIGHHFSISDF
jgi:hypothetical protein